MKLVELLALLVSRFASGMVKAGEEKEMIHAPECFLTVTPLFSLHSYSRSVFSYQKQHVLPVVGCLG